MDIDPLLTTAVAVRQMDRLFVLHLHAVCASFGCAAAVEQCDLDQRPRNNGVWYALSPATRYPHKVHKETHTECSYTDHHAAICQNLKIADVEDIAL